jgi:hypothetical protein
MRPTASESLRAIQSATTERLVPELQSLFAQEAASAVSMLVESLAAEADSQAQDLRDDNARMRSILNEARETLRRNEDAASLVTNIDWALADGADNSILISHLTAENDRLGEALAQLLEYIEDVRGAGNQALDALRVKCFRHLRRVAVRGWSYLDVSGFRERIVKARAEFLE